jgi:hypothetical protein
MANAVQDAKSRASLLQMAQVWSRLQIRVFQIGLLRKPLPSPGHFLQDPLLLFGFCLLRQTAAFLREALVLG